MKKGVIEMKRLFISIGTILFLMVNIFIVSAGKPTLYDKLFPVIDPKYRIVSEDLYYPSFDFVNKRLYYLGGNEHFAIRSYDLWNKTKKAIIEIDDICSLVYSPNYTKAIAGVSYQGDRFKKYQSPFLSKGIKDGELTFWLIDFSSKKISKFGRSIQSFYWENDNNLIVHYHNWVVEPEINYIGRCDLANGTITKVIDQPFYEVKFFGIFRDNLYFMQQPTESPHASNVFEYNISSKQLNQFTDRDDIYDLKFSPDYKHCLILTLGIKKNTSSAKIFDMNARQYIWQMTKDCIEYNYYAWGNNETVNIVSRDRSKRYYLYRYNITKHTLREVKLDIKPQVDVQRIWANNNNLFILANNFMYQMQL